MVELLSLPEKTTITDTFPELSWVVNDPDPDELQTAYQILVASSLPMIIADQGNVWDSGKILSDQSTAVSYAGPELTYGFTYYWKVRTWDRDGNPSPYSTIQQFKVADVKWDWSKYKAALINAGLLRFYLGGYIESQGGSQWGKLALDCDVTIVDQGAGILFRVQDENNHYLWRLSAKEDMLSLYQKVGGQLQRISSVAQDFENKRTYHVRIDVNDTSFQCSINGRLADRVQGCDKFSHGKVGFSTTTTEMMDVDHVVVKAPDGEILLADDFEKTPNFYRVEVTEIAPATFVDHGGGHYFIDFGKAAFGTLRLMLTSPAGGERVVLRLGEMRKGSSVEEDTPGNVVSYKTELILHGGTHAYTVALPKHAYKEPFSNYDPLFNTLPFRYCDIENVPAPLRAKHVTQLAVFYPFDETASHFECSNPALNAVWDLCKYTIKACSAMGIYIDGHRERQMNEGDTYIQQLSNYCVDREYSLARRSHEHVIYDPSTWTEYVQQSVLVAWSDYLFTGDKDSLVRFYDTLKAKSCCALREDNQLISTQTGKVTDRFRATINLFEKNRMQPLVDWPRGERDGYVFTPYNTVANAVHYEVLVTLAEIATLLDKPEDASTFAELAKTHRDVFNQAFWDANACCYTDGIGTSHASLHANVFPLAHGLVPDARIDDVADTLVAKGIVCGTYGSYFMLKALYEAHRGQAALDLMTATGLRSWRNMIRSGSTITMESFDNSLKSNLDWNHAWASAPASIIPMYLMGVQPLEAGFKKIRIQPQTGDLESARLKMPTVRGTVEVDMVNTSQHYRLRINIPSNTCAMVYVPHLGVPGSVVRVDGKRREGVETGPFTVFDDIGSGTHVFERNKQE